MKEGATKLLGATQLLRVMGSQSASMYANQVIAFVIPWLVLTRTGSAANAGFVAFAMGAAAFIGTLCGGIVTDRIGGRKVSIIADALSLITALILAITLFFDFFALWLVIVSQVVGIFFDGPGSIAKNTMVPNAASEHKVPLVRAMGLQQTLQNLAMFVGPVSAGALIAVLSESVTLAVASALFLLAIVLISRLKRQVLVHERPMSTKQAIADMRDAVAYIIKEPLLAPMQLFGPWFAFMLLPISSIIIPAWFVFANQSSGALGLFLGVQALGGMLGGFAFAAVAPKVSQQKWFAGATTLYALALLGLYFLSPGSLLTIMVGFLVGLSFTGIMAIPYTAFYMRTPQKFLGRVNSIGASAGYLVASLGALFFGWLVSTTSPKAGIMACAIGMAVLALGILALPFMKLLDEPPVPAEAPQPAKD